MRTTPFILHYVVLALPWLALGEAAPVTITHRLAEHAGSAELRDCWLDREAGDVVLKPLLHVAEPVQKWQHELGDGPPWELVYRLARPRLLKGLKILFPKDRLFECRVHFARADAKEKWSPLLGPVVVRGEAILEWDEPVRAAALKLVVSRSAPFSGTKAYASDLEVVEEKASFRKYRKDTNIYGQPLVIGDKTYAKGLGCHARSQLVLSLDGKFSAFESDIGLNDTARRVRWGYVIFRILLDGKTAFESPLLNWRDPPMHVGIVTQGAKTLRLVLDPGPSGSEPANRTDHASWGGAVLYGAREGDAPPPPKQLRLAALGVRRSAEGTYTSMPVGVGSVQAWGSIRCVAETPDGTALSIQTRSGNTFDTTMPSWSDWSTPVFGPSAPIASPLARYLQYRVHLKTEKPRQAGLRLREVSFQFDDGGARRRTTESRFGVCHLFASEYEYDKLAELARQAGIGLHRTVFDWDKIEWERGRFDWERTDTQLGLLAAHDIGSVGLLWTDLPPNYSTGEHARPTNMEDWSRFVQATVRRYRGAIKRWELWNEPDTGFYKGTLDEYRALMTTTYRAAKAADPSCLVSCGGMTPLGIFGWFEKLCEKGGWDAFDAVAYHPYTDADPPEHRIERFVYQVRKLENRYGGKKRLWFTESGWQAEGGWLSARDEQQKAAYTVRNYVATLANGIDFTLIYRMATIEEDKPESDFGLLNAVPVGPVFSRWRGQTVTKLGKLSPKPAYEALKVATGLLRGAQFVGQLTVGDVREGPGDGIHHRSAYAYVFENGDRPVVVAYAFREEDRATLELNCGTDAARLLDMFGRQVGNAGKDGMLVAELVAEPMYVVGARSDAVRVPLCFRAASRGMTACAVGDSMGLVMAVRNITDRPLQGTLAPVLPDGWTSRPASSEVVLAPGEAGQLTFRLEPESVRAPAALQFRFSSGERKFPAIERIRVLSYAPEAPLYLEIGEERVLEGRNRSLAVNLTGLAGEQKGVLQLELPKEWSGVGKPVPFSVKEKETREFALPYIRGDLRPRKVRVHVRIGGRSVLARETELLRQYEWTELLDLDEVAYLCDLKPLKAKVGHGQFLAPASVKVCGREYRRALYAHANSALIYRIPAKYRFLESDIGIREGAKLGGTARFEVYVNGKLAYRSQLITRKDPAPVHVGIAIDPKEGEDTELKLVTSDAGDGKTCDWTVWGDPRLLAEAP